MASSSGVLSEKQFLCAICLDVFNRPVSTPCGHNFCMSCITTYWENTQVSQCPVCKETFQRKPNLKVNTFISQLVSSFRLLQLTEAPICSGELQQVSTGGVVCCDVCTDVQNEAVRSCLECLMSYCHVHLEPHGRAAGLKTHTLIEPVASLEHRICRQHNRLSTLFCKNDNVLLCDACDSSHHVLHNVLPVQQVYIEMKDLVMSTELNVQEMIQERLSEVQNVKKAVRQIKDNIGEMMRKSQKEFTELVIEVQEIQEAVIRFMEKKQKATEEQADLFIRDMKWDTTELQRTAANLRELSQTEDQFSFLHRFQTMSLLPHTMHQSTFSLNRNLEIQLINKSVSRSVSQLSVLLNQMSLEFQNFSGGACESKITLKSMQQYQVDVLLDPNTAHPMLAVSNDLKRVLYSTRSNLRDHYTPNPNSFNEHFGVLGTTGFSSQNFYFEVFVGKKTEWCLGVATASVLSLEGLLPLNSQSGLWAIWFLENKFESFDCPDFPVYVGKAERVGVFVDYDEGQISFYDVMTAALIHLFRCCFITEPLHPYLNPGDNESGSNSDPMVIVPVGDMD